MKTLNPNTKRAKAFIRAYWNSNDWSLYHCYKKFSHEKYIAYERCVKQMTLENGIEDRIISHNTFGFTFAWIKGNDLRVETPQNSYIIPNFAKR